MRWTINDIDMYLKSADYVDSAIIPLIPFGLGSNIKSTVTMGEFIGMITYELERQFKGRLLLLPQFTYMQDEAIETKKNKLFTWCNELKANGIKHIFILTSDSEWKQIESIMEDMLIWLPALPLEHLDDEAYNTMMKEQVNQLIPLFINTWREKNK
ncbi:YpiF family protein [Bacillus sp. SCS-151]|uniref:YpiF family protein n=1 Tax=Nanhaiella sioensis TaxID=3115293 RepID=UPI0039792883